jgi:hypothetical protein
VLVRARRSWCIAAQNKRESLRDAAQITCLTYVLTCLLALSHGHLSWMPADVRHNAQLTTPHTDIGLGLFERQSDAQVGGRSDFQRREGKSH